ncbi:hypothetical protein ED733_001996 [Metarhizium rileyi]|uniref:Uncharacterized protein n=1 Tax=Metarhizium rileyi (strain RCEF 4871) TaxID=1649241 RepID=A0A5C6G2H4_METRR|nr:hypothetical protein ED733_001996 [Metarhizium rileyi]
MTDDPTHAFASSHHCYLCGSEISLAALNRRSEGWKAVAQELKHPSPPEPRVPQPLVKPGFCSHVFEGEEGRVVHAACWGVVVKLWGKTTFTIAELDSFVDCARNVAPFLPEIPFKESPEQLDITIDHRLDASDLDYTSGITHNDTLKYWEALQGSIADEGIIPPSLLGISSHEMPPQLESFITHVLRNAAEVRRSADQNVSFWTEIIGMLANSPAAQFSSNKPDRPLRIAQAVRNLRLGGTNRFPHTANFDTVRANCLTILITLIPIPVEDVAAEASKGGKRARLERPRSVPLVGIKPPVPFRLNFYTIRRMYFVQNMNDRGYTLGMKYLRTIEFDETRASASDLAPTMVGLCGVRLIRDRIGVLAVHAKDGPNWVGIWQQDPSLQLSPEMAIKLTSSEWPVGSAQGSLVVVGD